LTRKRDWLPQKSEDKWYYSFFPYNVAGGSTSPLIPLFITEGLKGTMADVGMASAISSAASVPSYMLWGNLSDTVRKRRLFVLLGFGGLALALFMMGISTSIADYFFANFILGLLATAAPPVGTVLVLEAFSKSEWARRLGEFSRIGGIGWVTGLVLGVIWLQITGAGDGATPMRALFVLASALSVLSMLLAMRWIREPEKKVERRTLDPWLMRVPIISFEKARYLPNRIVYVLQSSALNMRFSNFPQNLRRYYLVVFLTFAGSLCFYVALPIFLKDYAGISASEVFMVYVASSIVSAATYRMAGRWVESRGGKSVQRWAMLGRLLLFPTFFLVTIAPLTHLTLVGVFCILHGLVGLCWAGLSVAGNALVSNMAYKEFKAEGMGLYNSTQGLGSLLGSVVGGFVAQFFGFMVTFITASVFVIAAYLLLSMIDVRSSVSEADQPTAFHV